MWRILLDSGVHNVVYVVHMPTAEYLVQGCNSINLEYPFGHNNNDILTQSSIQVPGTTITSITEVKRLNPTSVVHKTNRSYSIMHNTQLKALAQGNGNKIREKWRRSKREKNKKRIAGLNRIDTSHTEGKQIDIMLCKCKKEKKKRKENSSPSKGPNRGPVADIRRQGFD